MYNTFREILFVSLSPKVPILRLIDGRFRPCQFNISNANYFSVFHFFVVLYSYIIFLYLYLSKSWLKILIFAYPINSYNGHVMSLQPLIVETRGQTNVPCVLINWELILGLLEAVRNLGGYSAVSVHCMHPKKVKKKILEKKVNL